MIYRRSINRNGQSLCSHKQWRSCILKVQCNIEIEVPTDKIYNYRLGVTATDDNDE